MQIGLTGGMGCGKSTAAAFFEARGFSRIDADEVVHRLLAEDAETIAAVSDLLGPGVMLLEGGIDRRKVAERVFKEDGLLRCLEAILHPRVRATWQRMVSDGGDWVVEIPLLFEKKLQNNVDLTVCVFSDPVLQVERLTTRGIEAGQARDRISRQMPLSEKAELADYVLLNDGSLEALEEQVDRLIAEIRTT